MFGEARACNCLLHYHSLPERGPLPSREQARPVEAGAPRLPVTACPDTDPWVTAAPASAEEGSPSKAVLRKPFRTVGLCFRQEDLKNQSQDFPAVQGLRLLPPQGAGVPSLVREPRSHLPSDTAHKISKQANALFKKRFMYLRQMKKNTGFSTEPKE